MNNIKKLRDNGHIVAVYEIKDISWNCTTDHSNDKCCWSKCECEYSECHHECECKYRSCKECSGDCYSDLNGDYCYDTIYFYSNKERSEKDIRTIIHNNFCDDMGVYNYELMDCSIYDRTSDLYTYNCPVCDDCIISEYNTRLDSTKSQCDKCGCKLNILCGEIEVRKDFTLRETCSTYYMRWYYDLTTNVGRTYLNVYDGDSVEYDEVLPFCIDEKIVAAAVANQWSIEKINSMMLLAGGN